MELLLDKYELQIGEIALVPSSGGRFEVTVDGELVFSKLAQKRFPEDEELIELVGARISAN
ncbi:MAG: Rdx family protein [Thermomicrobium sp.]|uniref:SelT/SelW/selH n=1 Tax=Thermomicrobium roseum (strain ATCC 27502 / DSM 5159 / P-2) TaxID=309801 RepID=B9L3Q6_THERP|nr:MULTISPECIES: Rdx family protein [Thermomicrobium]ACM06944.1 SelT/SelW/selH [Thermomicrobium roseum DSM 5159]MBO9352285.1 Rdx family protein [Thermomicrobium sp.]MBO9360373.1 Rdx family protein [Thermomicrobium sp.]MBO9386184.1 Rdx family protein [Thermomicrobium sp.]MBO9405448.1 Rdx family protein [Thermomicrobium sp.]